MLEVGISVRVCEVGKWLVMLPGLIRGAMTFAIGIANVADKKWST